LNTPTAYVTKNENKRSKKEKKLKGLPQESWVTGTTLLAKNINTGLRVEVRQDSRKRPTGKLAENVPDE